VKGTSGTTKQATAMKSNSKMFGDMIPYGDPSWYQRFNSPYYKDTHKDWRAHVRRVANEVFENMYDWKNSSKPPADILLKLGEEGLLAAMCGGTWPSQFLPDHVNAKKPVDFDYFHELIGISLSFLSSLSSLSSLSPLSQFNIARPF